MHVLFTRDGTLHVGKERQHYRFYRAAEAVFLRQMFFEYFEEEYDDVF